MPASLNPRDVAVKLAELPQQHFVGEEDKVVPTFVADGFVRAVGDAGRCATITQLRGVTHAEGWEEAWRLWAGRLPMCR